MQERSERDRIEWGAGEVRLDIAVIGLGLIGGSLARALTAAGHRVRGYDAARQARAAAAELAVADSLDAAVRGADLVVLAVPLPAVPPVLDQLAGLCYAGLLSDVTSVKGPVAALVARQLPGARYVGGHPMAGKESSGFAASDPELFAGCAWALTLDPPAAAAPAAEAGRSQGDGQDGQEDGEEDGQGDGQGNGREAGQDGEAGRGDGQGDGRVRGAAALGDWVTVARLVIGLGARVVPVTADEHDLAVARISHLPHLAASALAATAGTGLTHTLAAGSYRDGTRVAASAPPLVAAMCGGNAEAVRPALDELLERLTEARARLDGPDPIAALTEWLAPGHAARAGWPVRAGRPEQVELSVGALLAVGRDGGWLTAVAADGHTGTAVRPVPGRG